MRLEHRMGRGELIALLIAIIVIIVIKLNNP